ncbi:MAG TPA: DoxX family protein [Flavobacteriales bacterium]|nr:DoxX family protein [Flavobacteriales bacterium]
MSKRNKIIYWIATCWLALGMVSTGAVQLLKMKEEVDNMTHLGYPIYFLTILGTWKMLGVVAVLLPRFALVKEWAYAGFFFAMSGAIVSRLVVGDPFSAIAPALLLLVLAVISWYFRPADRRLVAAA